MNTQKKLDLTIIPIFISVVLLLSLLVNCARRGRPTGGPKDLEAPKMISSVPKEGTTNFKSKDIKIYFDEYIKLKKVFENLVISPPLKHVPIITPLGASSKYINIKIMDTLQANTTYIFNFGESIADITEGNVLKDFKFIFSTGNVIDSLKIKGTIKDAFLDEIPKNASILLYKFDKKFNDSIIYNKKPTYISSTFGKKDWEISNIKEGDYLLIALHDVSKNLKFNPKEDAIAFKKEIIHIPTKKSFNLSLFNEIQPYKLYKPKEISKGHLIFGFSGSKDSVKLKLTSKVGKKYQSVKTFDITKDTLNYWFKNTDLDSLQFTDNVTNKKFTIALKSSKPDSLIIGPNVRNILPYYKDFKIGANIPLINVDTSKISLIDKDSVQVHFTTALTKEKNILLFKFIKTENNHYKMKILPNAIKSFFDTYNPDTINYKFATRKYADYGNVFLTLQNVKRYPIIVQILDQKYEVIEQEYLVKNKKINFENLPPSKYKIRIIYDDNKNKKWDTGNYLRKIQPEKVLYYSKIIDVRANWDITETFSLP